MSSRTSTTAPAKPYRVVYQYPGQKPGRIPCADYLRAVKEATVVARYGGTATILLLGPNREETRITAFGPGVAHGFEVEDSTNPAAGLVCRCGFRTRLRWGGRPTPYNRSEREVCDEHMDAAGLCRECWGAACLPARAADGTPGELTECPYCSGTGDADVSYLDTPRDAYVSRYETLTGSH